MTTPTEGMVPPPAGPPPPSGNPREMVKIPALGLMISSFIGALFALLWLLLNILDVGLGFMASESGGDHALNFASGGLGIFMCIVELGVAGFIVYGSLQMKDLGNYPVALIAAIASMIPCISPCCVVGLPAGIWALMVISKSEVKAAFAKK